ncbi:hypothetical protein [Modestobacter sp. NPDC049651]|uniref:hypothetical protein n=1 Tax=unclassified Modestobacter TaxID=2643866 RepID=UPI0033C38CF7
MSTAADAQPGTWITVGVLVGLALALLLGILLAAAGRARAARAGRRPARHAAPPPAPPAPPAAPPAPARFEVDDLPGFLESPPGSPVVPAPPAGEPPAAPAGPPAAGATAGPAAGRTPDRATTLGTAGAAALLVAAVVVALVGGGDTRSSAAEDPPASPPPPPEPVVVPTPPPSAAPADDAPGAAAWTSVPLGRAGLAVSATFGGVVLEQRAVGLTVTYPSLSVTTDGSRSLAHLRLPTWNCLTAEPPADPASAGCARSLVEYADLAGPALRVSRDGDRVDVAGSFPTYLRPTGSAPAWTGRSYELSASAAPDGAVEDGRAAAAGVVRIGLGSAPTVAAPGVNLLLLPR